MPTTPARVPPAAAAPHDPALTTHPTPECSDLPSGWPASPSLTCGNPHTERRAYTDLNRLKGQAVSSVTAPLRAPGAQNSRPAWCPSPAHTSLWPQTLSSLRKPPTDSFPAALTSVQAEPAGGGHGTLRVANTRPAPCCTAAARFPRMLAWSLPPSRPRAPSSLWTRALLASKAA